MRNLIILAGIILSAVQISSAQNDKKAKAILSGVSAKYKSYQAIKAEFSYTLENPQEKINETQTGTLHLKGNKYRLNIAGQEVISDGKTIWTYLKDAKEVQVNTVDPETGAITPSEIFTMYEKGYSYLFVEEKTINGKVCQIVDLTPLDKTKSFFKVRLTIDKAAKQIVQSRIFDKNGNRYIYTIKSFAANPKLADTFFMFDPKKYPGIEVVDLR